MSRPIHNFTATAASIVRQPFHQRLAGEPPRGMNELDIASRLVASLRLGGDIREGKVARLRSAIDSNAYENDLKLSVAVDRLLEKLEVTVDCE